MGYAIPESEARFEQEIKKSRFIGAATRVGSPVEAAGARKTLAAEFPDANHHCFAYVIGDPATSAQIRMSDDGEPSGTAGRPILNVVQHKNVGDILLVVVRYFGGVKLGAGGLVRAYSSTASGVFQALPLATSSPLTRAVVVADYPDERPLRAALRAHEVEVLSSGYGERVELTIRFPTERSQELQRAIVFRTSGRAKFVAI